MADKPKAFSAKEARGKQYGKKPTKTPEARRASSELHTRLGVLPRKNCG